jgi:hypothetical protein
VTRHFPPLTTRDILLTDWIVLAFSLALFGTCLMRHDQAATHGVTLVATPMPRPVEYLDIRSPAWPSPPLRTNILAAHGRLAKLGSERA